MFAFAMICKSGKFGKASSIASKNTEPERITEITFALTAGDKTVGTTKVNHVEQKIC